MSGADTARIAGASPFAMTLRMDRRPPCFSLTFAACFGPAEARRGGAQAQEREEQEEPEDVREKDDERAHEERAEGARRVEHLLAVGVDTDHRDRGDLGELPGRDGFHVNARKGRQGGQGCQAGQRGRAWRH